MNKISSCLLAIALSFAASVAHATTLDFDWALEDNGETLSGVITGLTDNAASDPTHFYIDSAGPTPFPEPLPLDLEPDASGFSSISVTNGVITGFNFASDSPDVIFDFFTGFDVTAFVDIGNFYVGGLSVCPKTS